ncbi:MAG: LamB/YcsF family protein [Saprospiraceae bacterium]|nr:LamB/YcsF family protein [Saprospiraceae bacterium]MCB9319552.1 LamB/YcsF family protein [Lewinellaceae bacterium]
MASRHSIDINCDMGESFGIYTIGQDEKIFPYITSCSIACGFHGGDPLHIEKTIIHALHEQVSIGAHPSYPDLAGFGRRKMSIAPAELKAIVKYQIAAIKGMTEAEGGRLAYVKPHGALYNTASDQEPECLAIIQAILEIDDRLPLMGLAGSRMEELAQQYQHPFIAEAFADRHYEPDGQLRSRAKEDAVILDPAIAAEQVLSIILKQEVIAIDGSVIPIKAHSICIHGDNPQAVDILQAIDKKLEEHGIQKQSIAAL